MELLLRYRVIIVFFFLSFFCLFSLTVNPNPFTSFVENTSQMVIYPFQKVYNYIPSSLANFWENVMELRDIKKKLKYYKDQVHNYESKDRELLDLKRENQRLSRLLKVKKFISYDSISAKVFSKNPDNWFKTLIIDKGVRDGVQNNMPVITYQEEVGQEVVVGKTCRVSSSLSKVIPFNALGMKIGVKFKKNNSPGLLSSLAGDSEICLMDYVNKNIYIEKGDEIVTSGQGGIFPPGLLVGKVFKKKMTVSSTCQTILVRPVVDYSLLENVFIIKKVPSQDFLKLLNGEE